MANRLRGAVLCSIVAVLCAGPVLADPAGGASAVLAQEQRWVDAAARQDAAALAKILAPQFVHVNYLGRVRDRAAELQAVRAAKPYREVTSGRTVTFAGNVAIVHGLNAIYEGARVVLRLRYVDVYESSGGTWRALSAQETAIQSG